jgi:hypothetical protein
MGDGVPNPRLAVLAPVGSNILLYGLDDPNQPNTWFGASALSHVGPAEQVPSSPTLIAAHTTMYLFWTTILGGRIYRANMPIDDFPGVFTTQSEVVMSSWPGALTGSIQIYIVKGNDQYLMILEVRGNEGRYLTSYTVTSLNGPWTPQATSESNPFAGRSNSGAKWTVDISRADVIPSDSDQTFTIDPCHLELLYQGHDPNFIGSWEDAPYRPGFLIQNTAAVAPVTSTTTKTKSEDSHGDHDEDLQGDHHKDPYEADSE